jgi:hypothetical protein
MVILPPQIIIIIIIIIIATIATTKIIKNIGGGPNGALPSGPQIPLHGPVWTGR